MLATGGNRSDFGEHATKGGNKRECTMCVLCVRSVCAMCARCKHDVRTMYARHAQHIVVVRAYSARS